jgi:rhodanese-related sulfurtransferase
VTIGHSLVFPAFDRACRPRCRAAHLEPEEDRERLFMDVTTLTTEELAQGVADGTILVIDVREPPEFAAGHIPGSVLMPLSQFDPASIPAPAGQRIVFSCAAGVRSLRALEFAQSAGLDLHEHYAGGFRGWVMSGGQVETG